ncbi:molecular chaperone [Rosenbergiella australiborealis]|uniref:Molecular chaperone n=1 Tax=Rosenbergiella australiborealis TaxID=1544696 RepID=A0ABS5T3C7_9GAMM|nr:molecular chaperone [Rosenbergiella australiborealis]MBT0726862.1 molecular chaperone [Rosenbergiella australiborealis]
MVIGFDYGTANCSVAIEREGQFQQLPIAGSDKLLPSMISAPIRSVVSEWLYRHHGVSYQTPEETALLQQALRTNRDEDLPVSAQSVQFGLSALSQYIADPQDVWFVKSPKSFLGAKGLKPQQIAFFDDVVCAMMLHIRQQAEQHTQTPIEQAVIGRPVNFQGTGGEEANQQAIGILRRAALRAGFRDVEFQFEPVAAGLEYESQLTCETRVLVVDIGGGTTDCSLLLMGPEWRDKAQRSESLLAHSGCRVGGNDLDIMLAYKQLMPLLGAGSPSRSGKALPLLPWWNAVAINDVMAQGDFYSPSSAQQLQQLVKEAQHPELVTRLLTLWREKQSYQIVRSAEQAKIDLSVQDETCCPLDYLENGLTHHLTATIFREAIESPLQKMLQQVVEVMQQATTAPQVIYLTGGSARSPLLRHALEQLLPNTPIIQGDDFGSVTLGLTRWANTLFR